MTEMRCDRCNAVIKPADEVQVSLNAPGGNMEIVAEDLCERCAAALRDFCRPLPIPATEPR